MSKLLSMRAGLAALLLFCAAGQLCAETVAVDAPRQAWQIRREALFTALSNKDHAKADAALDKALTDFEKNQFALTPMEAMDLYGIFYVPHEGEKNMTAVLKVVAMQAALGWYDALRFADESGRAEIVNNEGFFKRAFVLNGDKGLKQLLAFLDEHPDEATQAVSDGIALARKFRGQVDYDEHWPSAYGLTVTQCGLKKAKSCPPPPALPKDQWDSAFEQAITQVIGYYRKNR